jgi:hypothetical protein
MEEINVEAECKNCNHAIGLHTPRCSKLYHEFTGPIRIFGGSPIRVAEPSKTIIMIRPINVFFCIFLSTPYCHLNF